jgi:hypothetical protein
MVTLTATARRARCMVRHKSFTRSSNSPSLSGVRRASPARHSSNLPSGPPAASMRRSGTQEASSRM